MYNKQTLTSIFLKEADIAVSDPNIKLYARQWWKNPRTKISGGLRLTDVGYDFLKEKLELKFYEVPLPRNLKITTETIIFLDKFITCPFYLTDRHIYVTEEKKAVELHLFSGDLHKYGLTKAMSRYD